jgi:hypothetical protein
LQRPDFVVGEHQADEAGFRSNRLHDALGADTSLIVRRHVGYLDAEPLQVFAGVEHGMVLDRCGDDVASRAGELGRKEETANSGVSRL